MPDHDIALMAHLMRRAGFGASRVELEARVAKGYDATVEELLHPERQPELVRWLSLAKPPGADDMELVPWDSQKPLSRRGRLLVQIVMAVLAAATILWVLYNIAVG